MLNKCTECRSDMELEVSTPFESNGANEQVISLRCTRANKSHCPVGIAWAFDADISNAGDIQRELAAVWNRMSE